MKTNPANFVQNMLFNGTIALILVVHYLFPDLSANRNISEAYLDPSTGSMIISAIVGVFATIVLGIKTFWYKIVRLFKPSKAIAPKKDENNK